MRTWHETILHIRTQPAFKELVEKAYFEEDLGLNVERFKSGEEFKKTLLLLKKYAPNAETLLDIGSGNGISAISFALNGYKVTVSEPDPSDTVGAGAIRKLIELYGLAGVNVYEEFAENIQFPNGLFDVVYVRQAMHHAYDLNQFVKNLSSLIKPGGVLLTIRDHVIYNEEDKDWFLESHPLHRFYGGENAFTVNQYRSAMEMADLHIEEMMKYYDSEINYFPMTEKDNFTLARRRLEEGIRVHLTSRFGILAKLPIVGKLMVKILFAIKWAKIKFGFSDQVLLDERHTPGRMYSLVARKR